MSKGNLMYLDGYFDVYCQILEVFPSGACQGLLEISNI